MTGNPRIVLRYFNARGRAQFIRYYFTIRRVPYTDERVPLSVDFSEWQAIRDDTAVTGPFKKLPVLHFEDEMLAETLVISAFLHEQLGDAARLSATDNLRHRMLVSSLYSDVVLPIGMLLWADRMYRGVDVGDVAGQTLGRVRRHLVVLNETLDRWGWLDRSGPETLADCLLWDQLMTTRQVFGKHAGLGDLEALSRFFGDFPARGECLKMLETQVCPLTGRPGEGEALDAIHAALDRAAEQRASGELQAASND